MSLYHLEKDGDVETLTRHLAGSESESVREHAAEILGEVGTASDDAVVEALVEAAHADESEQVRGAAIDALDRLGQTALEGLLAELPGIDVDPGQADWAAAEGFVQALSTDRPELRMAAANALGRLGNRKTVGPLVSRLTDDDPRVRSRAARALGNIGHPGAVDALVARLEDPELDVRREAAEALATIGTDQSLQALVTLLDDESPRVRHLVVSAIGEFGDPRPIDALVDALSDDSELVRGTAVFSIIELLSAAPRQQSHQIRETVVERLRQTDDESIIDPLVDILEQSRERGPRRNAAWLLGRIASDGSDEVVVEALADLLEDDDTATVQFATSSLASLGGRVVETRMLEVVDDAQAGAETRSKAVFVLGKVGGDRARNRLTDLVEEADEQAVRKQAFSALSKLGGRQ